MSTAYTQIIVSAKDEASKVFSTASRRIGIELNNIKNHVFSLQNAFAALGIGAFSKQIFDMGTSLRATKRAFAEIVGSMQGADKEFEFLRRTADALGQNFYDLLEPYKQLIAAAKGSALEGEKTRQIFIGIAKAGATLGLSSEQVKGALNAVAQMISKGKVQAEELRGQLGERLPGAFNLAAEAMGVTTAELDKMLKDGKITAEEFLPKFAQTLQTKFSGSIDEAVRATNKFREAWTDFKTALATGEYMDSIITALEELTNILKDKETQKAVGDLATGIAKTAKEMVKTGGALDDIFALYNKLPDDMKGDIGIGLLGAVLFGPKGGVLIGALAYEIRAIMNSIKGFELARSGQLDWLKFATMNAEELADYLKKIAQQNKPYEFRAKIKWVYKDGSPVQSTKEEGKEVGKVIELSEKEKQRIRKEFQEEYKKLILGEYEFERQRIEEQAKAYIKAGADKVKVEEWAQVEIAKLNQKYGKDRQLQREKEMKAAKERAEKILRLQEELEDEYKKITLSRFDYERYELDKYLEDLRQKGMEEVKIEEIKKIKLAQIAKAEADETYRVLSELYEKIEEEQETWKDKLINALNEYAESASDVAKNIETVFTNTFNNLEDALVEFVTTGKASFSDLVNSILADLARLTIRQTITAPLATALSAGLQSGFGSLFSSATTTTSSTAFSNLSLTGGSTTSPYSNLSLGNYQFASGDVFLNSPNLSKYENSIVSKPTLFTFASGMGLMGEAGPEAVIPLTRTSSGDLGVKAEVAPVEINIIDQRSASSPPVEIKTQNIDGKKQIRILIKNELESMIVRGELDGVFRQSYGLNRRAY